MFLGDQCLYLGDHQRTPGSRKQFIDAIRFSYPLNDIPRPVWCVSADKTPPGLADFGQHLHGLHEPVRRPNPRSGTLQSLVQVGSAVRVSTPKTASGVRTIPLDLTTTAALKAWKVRQTEERLAWGPGWQDTGYAFTRENGTPIHPDNASRWFALHTKAAGLDRIRFHDIRHTALTLLLANGVAVKTVSVWAGHANVGITLDTYTHVLPAMEDAASEVMASVMYGASK
jgi:hypothetical protein